MHKFLTGAIILFSMISTTAWGAGFEIPEVGARAQGVAMAFTSVADDASAAWFNPAGMSFLSGTLSTVGFTMIKVPATEFSGKNAGSPFADVEEMAKDDLFNLAHLYLVSDLGTEKIRLGLSINSPFGLAKRWPNGSGFVSDIVDIGIAPVYINPSIAYRLTPCISVAGGFTMVRSTVMLKKAPYNYAVDLDGNFDFADGDRLFLLDMEGHGTGAGFNFGFMVRPLDGRLSLGALFRSKVDIEYEGDVSIGDISTGYLPVDRDEDGIPDLVSQELFGEPGLRNTEDIGVTNLAFPAQLRFGLSYRVTDPLLLTFDWHLTSWSSYEELDLNFKTYDALDKIQEKNWENSGAFRFGAMYKVKPGIELSGGFVADATPIPDETLGAELPDSDRTGLTLGLHLGEGPTGLSIGFMHLMPKDRDSDTLVPPTDPAAAGTATGQDGTFKNKATLFGVSLTHAF